MHYEKFADGSVKCIEDEIPFELPDGWAWARIFSITEDLPYGTVKKSMQTGLVAVLRMGNIQSGEIDYSDLVYSSDIDDIKKYTLVKNDLLFNRTNSAEWVGKTAIYRGNMPAIYAGYLIRVRAFIDSEYLNVVMNSSYAKAYCNSVKTDGVNQSNINAQKLGNFLVPIPSLVEQKRISSSIVEFIPRISMIQEEKEHIADLVLQTKSKILDLAIRGQLVPQNSDDEPASVLLERIRAEKEELIKQGKIKRDKKESVIFKGEDNSYYDEIPDGWSEIALKDVCEVRNGYAFKSSNFSQNGTPIIRISDIQNETISIEECVYWNQEVDKRFVIEKGDLLIAMSGATTGKMGVYKSDLPAYLNQRVGNVRIKDDTILCVGYRDIYLRGMQDFILKNAYGGAQPNISSKFIEDIQILLPPYNEQLRIVEKVKILFQILNTIEKSLL